MEDIIIYSVGALAVRGLRRAVFGPSREEKLSKEVEQLQGVIAQQNARLQQLEETLKLPAAQVPQDALALALPGCAVVTSAGEAANGRHSPLKRPAPDGPSGDAAPVAKRSRWSIFPVARRRNAEEPAQPPSSPSPSNRALVVQSSSNPSTSTDQSASADLTETSGSESSGTSSSSDEMSDDSDAVDDSDDVEESSSEEEEFSDEEDSIEALEDGSGAVSASAITSGSESESEAEDEPSQVQSASKIPTSGSSGSSLSESASQTPSTSGPSSSIKQLSQDGNEVASADAAAIKQLEDAAEIKRLEDAAEIKRLQDAAEFKRREDAAEIKRLEDAAEIKGLQDAAEFERLQHAEEIERLQRAAEIKQLETAVMRSLQPDMEPINKKMAPRPAKVEPRIKNARGPPLSQQHQEVSHLQQGTSLETSVDLCTSDDLSDSNDSDDCSSDSDFKSEDSKDTEDSSSGDSDSSSGNSDSSSGDSDSMSDEADAAVAPKEQPALAAVEEQAALVHPAEDQGPGEVEGDGIEEGELEMGADEERAIQEEAANLIRSQVQEQIASAIHGLQIADSSLGEEEIMSDLQQMAAGLLPDSPQEDALDQAKQGELPEQPLLSSDAGAAAAAAAALPDGVHVEEAADHLVADSTPSRNIEVAAAALASPTTGSPVVTAASMRSPRVLPDERSGGDSRGRRSPKRRASSEDVSGEERRSRKRPRSLCSRLFMLLPRPLRTLKRFGGRGSWRGGRRPASNTSGSSWDLDAHASEDLLADPAESEEQAATGNVAMEQGSVFVATPDATGDEAADAATPEIVQPAQDEAAVDAACIDPAAETTRVPIPASGIFLTEEIAADDELSEEEKALLALADAEEQARLAVARFTQAPATQDIAPAVDVDSHHFALFSPQKTPVDEEWGNLSPPPPGSPPAAAYSPSLCRQQDYSGLSQDVYARSLSPLDRRSRSCSRGRSGSEQHPSYSRGRSLSPCPEQGHEFLSDMAQARSVRSLSPVMRRSPSEQRSGGSPIRSPSPRRSGLAPDHRSIPSLSPLSRRLRRRSVSKTSRSRSHSRGASRGRSRSRAFSGFGRRRHRSSSPWCSPSERSRSHTPRRFGRHKGTPSRSCSARHAGRSHSPRHFGRYKGTPSRSRSAKRAGRSLSRGRFHGDLSPASLPRRRVIALSPSPYSRSPSRSRSCDGGWGRDFNKQSPRYAASASPSKSRSPFCDGTLEEKLGSPSYSSYKKIQTDATDGELRQLVRDCEDLKATGDIAAHKAAKSPFLSQPGGRKRGVLLSPSRSPSPITSSPFSHQGAGVRLTAVQDTDLVGDGAEDHDQLHQDGHIIREESPFQSDPPGKDLVGPIHSPGLREYRFSPSPSPDRQQVRSAVWNPAASDASPRLRSVSRSRSRSPAASDGSGRSRGSPCKTQEPASPQPPSVLLSDANAEALLQRRPRPGTPIPDDSTIERAVRTTLQTGERPERSALATQVTRGLFDAWHHDMDLQGTRAAGLDDDEAPEESLFRRRMSFARRIFDRHRRRAPAGGSVMPRMPLFGHSLASITRKPTPTAALFRSLKASAPAHMPMAEFGNESVEDLVDLTHLDKEEDRQEPQSPTDIALNKINNNYDDPQPSYSQHDAGNQYWAGSDVEIEDGLREAELGRVEPELID